METLVECVADVVTCVVAVCCVCVCAAEMEQKDADRELKWIHMTKE